MANIKTKQKAFTSIHEAFSISTIASFLSTPTSAIRFVISLKVFAHLLISSAFVI
jgi:hypothetical protein